MGSWWATETWHYPNPTAAGFDKAVVGNDPISHLMALVPTSVVPDEKQSLLTPLSEPVAAPSEKLGSYGAHRATVHEPQPGLCHLRQVEPVAGEGLRLGIVLSRFFLKKSHRRLRGIRPRMQRRSLEAGEPGLVLEAQSPPRMALWASRISRSRAPFFGRIGDRGSRFSAWPAPSARQALRALLGWSRH